MYVANDTAIWTMMHLKSLNLKTLVFNLHKIPSALLRPRYGIKHFGIDPASCSKRTSLPSETVT